MPGAVETPLWTSAGIPTDQLKGMIDSLADKNLTKTIGNGADIAPAYLYLMTSAYVTGESIIIDGGACMA